MSLSHFHEADSMPEYDFLKAVEANNPVSRDWFYAIRDNNDEGFGEPYPNPTSLKWIGEIGRNNP